MAWQYGLPALIVGAFEVALAVVVFRARPDRAQNRWLAAVMLFDAGLGVSRAGLRFFTSDLNTARAFYFVAAAGFGILYGLVLSFFSTFPGSIARALSRRAGRFLQWGLLSALSLATLLRNDLYAAQFTVQPDLGIWWAGRFGPLLAVTALAGIGVSTIGAAIAFQSIRIAEGQAARRQARLTCIAIVMFLTLSTAFLAFAAFFVGGSVPDGAAAWYANYAQTFHSLVLVSLLSYGILKVQVFDIDLKVKWTIRRGTLVAMFLAAFFVVVAVAEQYLQQYGVVLGGVAVGLMLFALRPIERAANRVADAAMPTTQNTPEYAAFRKLEVYKAAVEELSVGGFDAKDRKALDALRTKLGIAAADAKAMERDARAGAT